MSKTAPNLVGRILAVDDEIRLCDQYRRLLEPHGYQVRMAASGEAALRELEAQDVDLLLLDLMNTPNQANGEFKLWIDDVLRTHVKGDTMYVYADSGGTPIRTKPLVTGENNYALQYSDDSTIQINRLWADMYFGGAMTTPDTSYIWLDNIVVQRPGSPKLVVSDYGPLPVSDRLSLEPNFPNPFNPETAIRFSVPGQGRVELGVYDLAGQRVRTLVDSDVGAGYHEYVWDGRGYDGGPVASGLYFYRLKVGEAIETRKMMLLK